MSFPADVISAAVALDLVTMPAVFGGVLLRVLSARQDAQEAVPELPPAPRQPVPPAAASGQQDGQRVYDPAAKRVTNQHGQLVGKKRLAELSTENSGQPGSGSAS